MPRSRLRWRALAVLGALLSIMIDWPISFALPATGGANNQHRLMADTMNPYARFSCTNCNASSASLNLTNSDRDALSARGGHSSMNISSNSSRSSSDSGANGDTKRTSKSDLAEEAMIMPSTTLASILRGTISNSNRSIPPERLVRVYNKRKRKKMSVARVTADLLRSMRTHNNHSLSSDVNNLMVNNNYNNINNDSESLIHNDNSSDESNNNDSPSVDPTTVMHAILDDLVTSTEMIATPQHLSRTDRSVHQRPNNRHNQSRARAQSIGSNSGGNNTNLDRNERSANLSHISGPARKIQLFIKNRWIQMLPDGTINGTQDDSSNYTILQRTTVDVGQIKIQGVATCLFLCMDQCGAVYGSKTFTDDCVFNESMEQHHYNTYSSTYNSNSRRTLYLALNRHGDPRKLQIPPSRPLGKLATYTKAMTSTVDEGRVEKLIAHTFGPNRVKHGLRQLCDAGKPIVELTTKVLKTRPKCNLLNNVNGQTAAPAASSVVSEKLIRIGSSNSSSTSSNGSHSSNGNARKKKKKRRCRPNENEQEHNCQRPGPQALRKRAQNRKCLPTQTPEECAQARKKGGKKQKGANQKKRKGSISAAGNNRKMKNPQGGAITKTTPTTTSTSHSNSPLDLLSIASTTTSASLRNIRQQLGMSLSQEEENVSTEESQQQHMQGSSEVHEGELHDMEDEDASMSALGGHAQLVNGDDFLYDDDFDV